MCLLALAPAARLAWFGFGTSTVLIGAIVYGLTVADAAATRFGVFLFSPSGFIVGAAEMLRVVGLFSIGMLAGRLIPADDLLPLVSRRPLSLYVAASLMRLVPSLRDDFERIGRTQFARGLDPRGRWSRPSRMLPILVPVFVNALRRARDQALALELAGVRRRRP